MKEIKIKTYKFNELDKDIQEKVIEEYKKEEYEYFCDFELEDLLNEEADILLKDNFKLDYGRVDNVYYDFSYCQGDGSQINFTINILELDNIYHFLTRYERKKLNNLGYKDFTFKIKQQGHYYHELAFTIDYWSIDDVFPYEFKKWEDIDKRIDSIVDRFKEDIYEMNSKLTKYGYNLSEDEDYFKYCAIDRLKEEDNNYFIDGSICYYTGSEG